MKLYLIFLVLAVTVYYSETNSVFLDKESASEYLHRAKRNPFEELLAGNAERECYEEVCDQEEAYEVYDNDVQGAQFWSELTAQCEILIPCYAVGTFQCVNSYNSFTCECNDGYGGQYCEIDINECDEEPCYFGNCTNTYGGFSCECEQGYVGQFCEVDFDDCSLGYCPEGSTCEDQVNAFLCLCPPAGCDVTDHSTQQQQTTIPR